LLSGIVDQTSNSTSAAFYDSILRKEISSVLLSSLDSNIPEKSQGPQPSTVKTNAQPFLSQYKQSCQLYSMYPSLSTNNCPSCDSEAKKVRLSSEVSNLDKAVAALREIPSSSHREDGFDGFAQSIAKDVKTFCKGGIRTSGRNSKCCGAKETIITLEETCTE
jgi:hypothetical protein